MIRRRAAVGLSLLCALVFCAFAAQGASAAGTTAFTCVPVSIGAQFSDKHCDTAQAGGAGFKHEEIAPKTPETLAGTETTGTNKFTKNATTEHTPAVLTSTAFGLKIKITCTKVHSEGKLNNTEEKTIMHAGGHVTIKYEECVVTETANCTVKQPIEAFVRGKTWEGESVKKEKEMGVEFIPTEEEKEGKKPTFVKITLEGVKCAAKGTFPVEGSVIGTPGNTFNGKGATLYFKENELEKTAMQKLTFGGQPAVYTGVETVEMKETTPTTGNAITLTTV